MKCGREKYDRQMRDRENEFLHSAISERTENLNFNCPTLAIALGSVFSLHCFKH